MVGAPDSIVPFAVPLEADGSVPLAAAVAARVPQQRSIERGAALLGQPPLHVRLDGGV